MRDQGVQEKEKSISNLRQADGGIDEGSNLELSAG